MTAVSLRSVFKLFIQEAIQGSFQGEQPLEQPTSSGHAGKLARRPVKAFVSKHCRLADSSQDPQPTKAV